MTASICLGEDDNDKQRDEKLISTFQIVRFPNDVCVGTNSRNGTCYTSAECSDKDGTSSGSCADGFGVCCTFVISTCGSSTSENVTYWTQPTTVSSGSCALTICPVTDDICSIRLDFTTFIITGPSTISQPEANRRAGTPAGYMENGLDNYGVSFTSNCLVDQFNVQGASPSTNPPQLCGTNSGFHMYVEADTDRCNQATFFFADAASTSDVMINAKGVNTLVSNRQWDITATQIECTSATLPPPGCTEYFWGSGTYKLFSYARAQSSNTQATAAVSNTHLANQHQRICIRRERGNCIGCFSTYDDGLAVSGTPAVEAHYANPGGCCGYITLETNVWGQSTTAADHTNFGVTAADANYAYGFDCIIIPGAFVAANDGGTAGEVIAAQTSAIISQHLSANNIFPNPSPPQICGSNGNIGVGDELIQETGLAIANYVGEGTAREQTICSRIAPFVLEFMSDDLEGQGALANADNEVTGASNHANQGFEIHHAQISC